MRWPKRSGWPVTNSRSQPATQPNNHEHESQTHKTNAQDVRNEVDGKVHSDDNESNDIGDPTFGATPTFKKRKGPQMSTFEKSVFDGIRRLSGWVDSVDSDSDSVLGRRTREKVLKAIEGDHNDQYDLVWDYIEELKRTHVGSTVFAEYDESDEDAYVGVFKRIYACFRPLIDGFKAGCKKLIGLDGCHIKGVHKDQILTTLLMRKTMCMSDKKKELESALHELLPNIGHRNCVQHIY
ncbi:hypothetical protein LIER_26003 [Lithospermum erythrorhizon]|uniref:Uncharacterized protein n=1 Tax=Lithospermum erythrorhizon TaxID=34254 RepID=A0AAV3RA20_LITER